MSDEKDKEELKRVMATATSGIYVSTPTGKSFFQLYDRIQEAGRKILPGHPFVMKIHEGVSRFKEGDKVTMTVKHTTECSWFEDDTTCNCVLKDFMP